MTEEERRVHRALAGLQDLFSRLYGLETHAVLIGGQVLALELLARGQPGELAVESRTGIKVSRGYTLEADLLFDLDRLPGPSDDLPDRLRRAGFGRTRDFRWERTRGDFHFAVDLFRAPGTTDPPTAMTEAAEGGFALNHCHSLVLDLEGRPLTVRVPDGPAFIAMKLAARPLRKTASERAKDSFDLYAYAHHLKDNLRELCARDELAGLRHDLRRLFGSPSADGVQDVLSYANLPPEESDLLARAVIGEFTDLLGEESQ